MFSSRDIGLLRPDVAVNCRMLIELCRRRGFPVLVTGTVRDAEFQLSAYENGRAGGKVPTFHAMGVGLAFDICQNIRGKEYNDPAFWDCVSQVGEKMGFEWGGRWKSIVDKPHFQWSEKGKFTSADILKGNYPGMMPAYIPEVEDMTEAELKGLIRATLSETEKETQKAGPEPWSLEDRLWAEKEGLIQGTGTDGMQYKAPCTREQMTAFLHRLYELIKKEKEA